MKLVTEYLFPTPRRFVEVAPAHQSTMRCVCGWCRVEMPAKPCAATNKDRLTFGMCNDCFEVLSERNDGPKPVLNPRALLAGMTLLVAASLLGLFACMGFIA